MLELRALGNAEIGTDKTTLTPSQEIVFASALYIVLERGKRISRSGLAELLWPAVEVSTRAHRLRQTLLQLKKLGFPVEADNNSIRLSTQQLRVDVDELPAEDVAHFDHSRVLEFLPGYSPLFSEPLRDWVDSKRSEVHGHCSRALLSVIRHERSRANWVGVEETARAVLRLEPFNESAVLALAEASAMRGQKREAVSMLDRYLQEMGSTNADLRVPASLLRKRILDNPPIPAPRALSESAFVGREPEMETLIESVRRAQKRTGGACLIRGEPGIGKSRLAAELAKFAELQGVRTQTVSCHRSNVDRPLSVLGDLVPALRDMPGALGCSQETLLALRRLTEFDTRGAEVSVATGESQALYRALRLALFDLVDAIADEASLLLIFDDVQWIDRASAEILAGMIEWAKDKRLLFVLSSRREETEVLELFARTSMEIVELKALGDDSAEALLKSIVDERTPDFDPGLQWILNAGEGNPFFLQELTKHWLEFGAGSEAPSSVNKVLKERLSRLDPVSLKVLQACTVLGQTSTIERVEGVLEYSSHELLGAIQELSEAGMLAGSEATTAPCPLTLRSRHDLLSGVVFETMSPVSRVFLHRRAGIALEKEISGERMPTALLWACAFHWHHAGDRDRALSVARSCADHLLEVGLPLDASEALDHALEYCSTDEQRVALLARQVEAVQLAGQWERSKDVLRTCRELRNKLLHDCSQHDAFELMLFDACRRTSLSIIQLIPEIMVCVACNQAATEHRIQAAIIALKIASDDDPLLMQSIYSQIEPILDETDTNDVSRIEAEMVYHSICGDGTRGLAAARAFVELARHSRDPSRLARALISASNSNRINATDREGEVWLREVIDCSLKHHFVEKATIAMHCLTKLALSVGNLSEAREMLKRSENLPLGTENLRSMSEHHLLDARLTLEGGDVEQFENALRKLGALSEVVTPAPRANYLALELQFRVRRGDDPSLLRPLVSELEALHAKIRAMGLHDFETESLFLGLKALGEKTRAEGLLRDYLARYRRDRRPLPPGLASIVTEMGLTGTVAEPEAPVSAQS